MFALCKEKFVVAYLETENCALYLKGKMPILYEMVAF